MDRPSHGGNLSWAANYAGCEPQQILDFSASINPLGPPQSAIAVLDRCEYLLRHYPDPLCGTLKDALSAYHQVPSDWILVGNGAAELLTWVGHDMRKLDRCYVMGPGFKDYSRALDAVGVKIEPWSIDICQHSLSSLKTTISPHSGCILNDPHNPTGKRVSPQFIRWCLSEFEQVVIDEAFLDFLPPDEQHSAIAYLSECPNLIILRSLTKFYSLPGLRIGYALAHPNTFKRWQCWRDPWSVNALAIEMGAVCMKDEPFQQMVWDWLPETRSHLFNQLQNLPGLTPMDSVCNFILVKCEKSVSQLQSFLLQNHQILIRDCLSFPELGDHYFRVAILSKADNEHLVRSLAEELSRL